MAIYGWVYNNRSSSSGHGIKLQGKPHTSVVAIDQGRFLV
jgi:hypothetical protein